MSIAFEHVESQMLLEGQIKIAELSSEEQVGLVMDDYDAALDAIADKMRSQGIYYFGITVSLKKGLIKTLKPGTSLRAIRATSRSKAHCSGRNPWKAVCPEFWLAASLFPSLHDRTHTTLNKIEHMLVTARLAGSVLGGLYEDDNDRVCRTARVAACLARYTLCGRLSQVDEPMGHAP